MKYITLFITLFLMTHTINANEENSSNWNYFGEFKTYFTKIHKTKEYPGVANFNELMNYNSLQLSIDYLNNNFYFSLTPYAYIYFTESGEELIGGNYSTPFADKEIFFRTFYMSYSFNKLSIGAGLLPLSNSFPMNYTSDYYQDGEGLSLLNDIDPLALFIKYKFNDENKILIGGGLLDTNIIPSGHYINIHNLDKSHGIFITQTILEGKFKIINDFKYTDNYFDSIKTGRLFNLGTGISWDDSEYSGWTLYNVAALSVYKNNSTAAKDSIIKAYQNLYNSFSNTFVFDDKLYRGAANLIGFRKDIDAFSFESFVNFEWLHVFGDWESNNKGAPYNSNCNQISNIRNNSFFLNYGVRIDELSTLKINYTYIEFKEIVDFGAPSATPVKDSFKPQRSSAEITKLSFSYKF